MQATVGSDDAVAVEVVVGGGIAAEVAAVGHDFLARHAALGAHTLIHEVPDETALVLGVLADDAPILSEAAHAVTHGVGIFTLDERTGIVALSILLAVAIAVVHGAEDVGLTVLACLLILYGAALVDGLHGIVGILEVLAVASFVAKAPEDDAGVVLLHLHIVLVALDMCFVEDGVLGEGLVAIAHAVALDVRLGNDIESIFIAEVIPARVIAVVASAHAVHVQLFHNLDILNHALDADDIATVGIQFMTVSTLDEDGLAVDEQLATLNLDVAETYALGGSLDEVALLVLERDGEGVEVGDFGTPGLGVGDGDGGNSSTIAHTDSCVACGAVCGVGEGKFHGAALGGGGGDVHRELAVLVAVHEILMNEDVLNMCLRAGIEIHLAGDACEAPEVLIFEV